MSKTGRVLSVLLLVVIVLTVSGTLAQGPPSPATEAGRRPEGMTADIPPVLGAASPHRGHIPRAIRSSLVMLLSSPPEPQATIPPPTIPPPTIPPEPTPTPRPPTIASIEPGSGRGDLITQVSIYGSNFYGTPSVYLDFTRLDQVSLVSSSELLVIVPAGFAGGVYDVTVANPDGQSVGLEAAYTVEGDWSSGGPYGGGISGLAVDPNDPQVVYAGSKTGAGYFKSTDGGEYWLPANSGLPRNSSCYDMEITPCDPAILYVSLGGNVYRSEDQAVTWVLAEEGLRPGAETIWDLAVAVSPTHCPPVSEVVLYAATDSGVYRSLNGGSHWSAWGEGLSGVVTSIDLAESEFNTLYAGTRSGEVYKSTDGGAHWSPTTAIPGVSAAIHALAVDPYDPDVVFVGEGCKKGNPEGDTDGSAYRTVDGGNSWQEIDYSQGWRTEAWDICFDRENPGTVYLATRDAGTLRSTDGGETWLQGTLEEGQVGTWHIAVTVGPSGNVYIGEFAWGVLKSENRGDTWRNSNDGIRAVLPFGVAAVPGQPEIAFMLTDGSGNFRTLRRGAEWRMMDMGADGWGEYGGECVHVANTPITPTVYIVVGGRCYRSLDLGSTWTSSEVPGALGGPRTVTSHPLIPGTLYAGTHDDTWLHGEIHRSTDGGATWSAVDTSYELKAVMSVAIPEGPPNAIYAATYGGGIVRSTDGGSTWEFCNTGLGHLTVMDILADLDDPDRLYAATWDGGVYITTDGGDHWMQSNEGLGDLCPLHLALDPLARNQIYAATQSGLYRSTNAGAAWSLVPGPLGHALVTCVSAASNESETVVYCGVVGSMAAVLQSSPGGLAALQEENMSAGSGAYQMTVAHRQLSLSPGWNLISMPLSPLIADITGALGSIQGEYDLAYAYHAWDAGDPWKKYNTAAPDFLNDLTDITETVGFWIRVDEAVELKISGSVPSSSEIALYKGWNLVGYPWETTLELTEALVSIDGLYDLVYAYKASEVGDPWKKYNIAAPAFLNDLKEMGPGWGYWIRVSQDCVWRVE